MSTGKKFFKPLRPPPHPAPALSSCSRPPLPRPRRGQFSEGGRFSSWETLGHLCPKVFLLRWHGQAAYRFFAHSFGNLVKFFCQGFSSCLDRLVCPLPSAAVLLRRLSPGSGKPVTSCRGFLACQRSAYFLSMPSSSYDTGKPVTSCDGFSAGRPPLCFGILASIPPAQKKAAG